MTLCRCICS